MPKLKIQTQYIRVIEALKMRPLTEGRHNIMKNNFKHARLAPRKDILFMKKRKLGEMDHRWSPAGLRHSGHTGTRPFGLSHQQTVIISDG